MELVLYENGEVWNQRDRAGLGRLMGKSGLLDQVRGNASVNDAEQLGQKPRLRQLNATRCSA